MGLSVTSADTEAAPVNNKCTFDVTEGVFTSDVLASVHLMLLKTTLTVSFYMYTTFTTNGEAAFLVANLTLLFFYATVGYARNTSQCSDMCSVSFSVST